jgi:hypothetical protein
MEVSGQFHVPAALLPRKEPPDTHRIGGWVGLRASLEAVVKRKIPSLCQNSNPSIMQPTAQRYTTELSRLQILIITNVKFFLLTAHP